MLVPLAGIQATFDSEIVDKGELPALLLVISFGATFGITRFITHSIRSDRFSWLGNVEAGDTHIHHLVWGICLLLVAGLHLRSVARRSRSRRHPDPWNRT